MCPVSMTYAVIPPLRDGAPELAAEWEPRLTLPDYEQRRDRRHGDDRAPGRLGRARQHHAAPSRSATATYELHGHKWFCSYPPCDVFLVLAQAPGGLSCFLVERGRGHGVPAAQGQARHALAAVLARSSSAAPAARLVGEEGRGVPTIIRMVNHTRLDCLIGSATGMRRGTLEAIHHARHRSAFGALLVDQPAMQQRAGRPRDRVRGRDRRRRMRVARALRRGRRDVPPVRHRRHEVLGLQARRRRTPPRRWSAWAATASSRTPGMPLLYRDAPLTSIWEGSGNVAALDVLRAMAKEPEGLPAFLAECELARGADARLDAHLDARGARQPAAERRPTRRDRRAVRRAPGRRGPRRRAAGQRCSSATRRPRSPTRSARRDCGEGGRVYGTLPRGRRRRAIVDRALPA